jgi:hypothetical protein
MFFGLIDARYLARSVGFSGIILLMDKADAVESFFEAANRQLKE